MQKLDVGKRGVAVGHYYSCWTYIRNFVYALGDFRNRRYIKLYTSVLNYYNSRWNISFNINLFSIKRFW